MKSINIYKIITVIAFLILIFILALPQFFNIDRKKNTDDCLKNMRTIYKAIQLYMSERNEDFIGTQQDLVRTGYLKKTYICKEGKPDDKYLIKGDLNAGTITVRCPHEEEFPDHKLPESMLE